MRIVIILAFIVPVYTFGQMALNIEVSKEMKMISAQKVAFPEISNPYEIKKEKDNFRWYCGPRIDTLPLPLIVVDGVFGVNIDDIESISFLKGEEAIASFGTEGTNGVILITTKELKEYEATVLDAGFVRFLTTQPSKNYYSETMLKNKNIRMVTEWNSRHLQPILYNPSIYEVNIDYDAQTNYGFYVEYTLYMFFKFMEEEHGIKLG